MKRNLSLLFGLLPILGLAELALHQYFATRAPGFEAYAALEPELMKLKRPGMPVVVAPAWAEPLVRQAAPEAFPIAELTRPDDTAFSRFLEVSLLGSSAPELADLPVLETLQRGAFTLRVHENPRATPVLFDFVTAVGSGEVEVFNDVAGQRTPCKLTEHARPTTGGLHGPVTRPQSRFECRGGGVVGVTLIEDESYRPHRCILVDPIERGEVVLRFSAVPESARLVGFVGKSAFRARELNRNGISLDLVLREADRELGQQSVRVADGWSRFELKRAAPFGTVEVAVKRFSVPEDFCFALEAR
jgi:hypothetical protein